MSLATTSLVGIETFSRRMSVRLVGCQRGDDAIHSPSIISESGAAALEFDALRQLLAEFALSEPGARAIGRLTAADSPDFVQRRFDRVAELRRLLSDAPCPLSGFMDLREWLHLIKEGAEPLETGRIVAVGDVIECAVSVHRWVLAGEPACRHLLSDAPKLSDLPQLAERIQRSFEKDGKVADHASPALKKIRNSLLSLRNRIRTTLESRVHDWADILQEPLVLIRRDRYVIPAKPGFRRGLRGMILDQSASGQTLYVEPQIIQSENDRLAELRVDEAAETYRILRELTDEIRQRQTGLEALTEWLIKFDVQLAIARFAVAFDCIEPEMTEGERIRLVQARHPLLQRQKGKAGVVPLDLHLERMNRQLIITGANTGGKTVALKTVGLLALMAHAGCPVPAAEGTVIPRLDRVFADIGDDQSLVQSLSTFSARLTHQVDFLAESTGRSLILLDELGAGTDPVEGSALSVALLEALVSRETWVIVTTHHEALKTYGDQAPSAMNAAVEFDKEKLSPAYRLVQGAAGTSYALDVAGRLGMPENVVERAKDIVSGGDPNLRTLGDRLEAREQRLQVMEEGVARDREAVESELAEARETRRGLGEQLERFQEKAGRFLRDARLEVHNLQREVRAWGRGGAQGAPGSKALARQRVADLEKARDEVLSEVPQAERPVKEHRPARAGDRVRSRSTGWHGVVTGERNGKGEWCVEANGKRACLPEKDLILFGREEKKGEAQTGITIERTERTPMDFGGGAEFELKLLGNRVEEAVQRVEKHLDEAALSGLFFVRIIHGVGTGVLKRAVAEVLEGHPLVKSFAPAEPECGGDGVTVVEMAGKRTVSMP